MIGRVLSAALLGALLVACGTTEKTPEELRSSEAQLAEAYGLPVDEFRYVTFMRDRIPGATAKTDAELIAGGHALCSELDGKSIDDIGVVATLFGFDMQEMADALVASVNTFCPEYDYLLA